MTDGKRLLGLGLALAAALCVQAEDTKPETTATKGGVVMILIPAGSFTMGDEQAPRDARPLHTVQVDSFYLDKYEVTQKEYARLMGNNPSRWKDPAAPVEQVRWSDAVRYCNARSKEEGLPPAYNVATWACDFSSGGYRLPTEAEWEYAARAGSSTRYHFGDDGAGNGDRGRVAFGAKLRLFAWTKENGRGRTHPVGEKHPNAWGLYDVYGNVWEWCHDLYSPDYYANSPEKNPVGPETGETRVVRGGCWNWREVNCSSGYRYSENPGYSDICFGYDIYGFRVARSKTGTDASE